MSPCPDCGEPTKLLRTGSSNSFVVVGPGVLDWFDGREWQTIECASCGHILSERFEPLEAPEATRLRALN